MLFRQTLSRAVPTVALLATLSPALLAQLPGGNVLGGQTPVAPPRSAQEQLDDLKREIDRLKSEIQFVEAQARLGVQPLKQRLQNRKFAPRAIDAGKNQAVAMPVPQPMKPQSARRMGEEELAKYPAEVVMIVQGRNVLREDIERLTSYLKTMPGAADEGVLRMRAAQEAIRIQAVMAAFEESRAEAESQVLAAQKELAEGKSFAEVQNRYGRGPNIAQEGKVQITRFSPFGLEIEAAAFTTAEGKLAGPLLGLTGYVLLQVDKRVQSSQDVGEAVEARLLLVPYHGDPGEMDKVRGQASMGQVDLLVRDDEAMALLPETLRPASATKAPTRQLEAVQLPTDPAKEDKPKKDEPKKDQEQE